MTTVRCRGEGGAEWDEDLYPEGTARRERFDSMVASGAIVLVGDDEPVPAPEPDESSDVGRPAGNASHDSWVEYAVSQGWDPEVAEATGRDDLRDAFGDEG